MIENNNDPTNDVLEELGIEISSTTHMIHDVENGTTLITENEDTQDNVDDDFDVAVLEETTNYDDVISELTASPIDMDNVISSSTTLQPPPIEAEPQKEPEVEDSSKLKIPYIPKDLTMDDITSRFSGASWYEAIQKISVLVGGAGGIGSNFIYNLARVHPASIYVYDDDIIERANLAGQMFNKASIGKLKVDSVATLSEDFSDYHKVFAIPQRFTEETNASDIMVAGFDNMAARKLFFNKWEQHLSNKTPKQLENTLFIDGRLSLDEIQIFCMTGSDTYHRNLYKTKYLFEDWQVPHTQCSMKQTAFCANMIGSLMVNLIVNFVANSLNPVVEHSMPFKTYYGSDLMYFKIED